MYNVAWRGWILGGSVYINVNGDKFRQYFLGLAFGLGKRRKKNCPHCHYLKIELQIGATNWSYKLEQQIGGDASSRRRKWKR